MTSSTAPAPTVTRRRPPAPVIVAAVLTGLQMLITSGGLIYFGLFVSADYYPAVGQPSAVAFLAVGLVFTVTGLASLPGLLRGRRAAWHLVTCVLAALIYFNFYSLLAGKETETAVFIVVDLVVVALLLLPSTRRHVSA